MSLLFPSTATATVAANTTSVSITGMDLTTVYPGMTINFGARDRKAGDAWIIATVSPSGTSGGTLTTIGTPTTSGLTNTPFVIDTLGFLGTDASYAAATNLALLSTLLTLFGPNTILYTGDRKLALDKRSSTAIGRILASINGRTWADLDHRTLTYTPTGGSVASTEVWAMRAWPDGTTPVDGVLMDTATGGCDVRMASATMASAATVDLGSAPCGKVAITGSATITSFGAGKHLRRLVHVVDGGGTLTHNATSLVLLSGANIPLRAGDCFEMTSNESGNWRMRNYSRADGTPLVLPASTQRASFRNRVRNGAFAINQRGVSGTVTLAAGAYGHDGWKGGASGATYTFSGSTLTTTAGSLMQTIEGGIYLPEGGTYTLSWTGTAQGRVSGGSYAASPVVITGVTAGANLTIEFGTGTLSLVQLEPGTVASPYEFRDDELRRCWRYAIALTEAQDMGGIAGSSSYALARFTFPTEMRADPTVSIAVAGSWIISDDYVGDATANPVAIGASGLRRRGGRLQLTGFSGLTVGRWYGSSNGFGSAVLIASAEL